jgi:hypothetical protein
MAKDFSKYMKIYEISTRKKRQELLKFKRKKKRGRKDTN